MVVLLDLSDDLLRMIPSQDIFHAANTVHLASTCSRLRTLLAVYVAELKKHCDFAWKMRLRVGIPLGWELKRLERRDKQLQKFPRSFVQTTAASAP